MQKWVLALVVAVFSVTPGFAEAPSVSFESQIAKARAAMMADPSVALSAAEAAEQSAAGIAQKQAMAEWLQGEALNRLNRPKDAIAILDRALASVSKAAPGSKLQGDVLMARARAAAPLGDYATALRSFQAAHDVFAALQEKRSKAMALMELGSIYADARDHQRALDYFRRAGEIYSGDPQVDLARLNNTANALRDLGRNAEAETLFRQALSIAERLDSPMLRARILTNIAEVQIAQSQATQADATARAALALHPEGWEDFLWGIRAQAAFARGDVTHARTFIERVFNGEDLDATTMPYREFHRSAHQIYAALDDPMRALGHLQAYKRLDDEARDVAASANMALMGAQFDFTSQKLQIAQLRTSALEAQARQRNLLVSSGLVVGLTFIGTLIYGYVSIRSSHKKVQAINVQLDETNEALNTALRAKSEFIATTSHEIRTPLNGILGMTQVMLRDRSLPVEMRERVQLMHGAGETMRAIVDDILDVAKMETGVVAVSADVINPRRALEDVGFLWAAAANAKGVDFHIDLDGCPALIIGDEQRLRQLAFNLLSNAVKFTDRGEIRFEAQAKDECFIVTVEDSGVGIPAGELDLIFTPFHQVNGSTARKHGGTGLGLSICRKLACAMGGDISVTSEHGAGSAFTVRLPLKLADTHDAAAHAACDVLVVENNPLHASLLETFCAQRGHVHLTVGSTQDALATLSCLRPRLLIVSAVALSKAPGEAMADLIALRDAAQSAHLAVALTSETMLAEPAARLCGADTVVAGAFDAQALLAPLSASASREAA